MIKFYVTEECLAPRCMRPGDAAYDLRAAKSVVIKPGETVIVGTGVYAALPFGYAGLLMPRSSAIDTKIKLDNTIGLIDSNYRGEIKAAVFNSTGEDMYIAFCERFVQLAVVRVYDGDVAIVNSKEELGDTNRQEAGFGSSGKQ